MSNPDRHAHLRDAERRRLEQMSANFVDSWRACSGESGGIALAEYLPPRGDRLRVVTLHELIPIDLDHRWHRREPRLLEDYLESYPELGTTGDLPVELIHAEYELRARHGDSPTLESYRRRFPRQFSQLQTLLNQQTNRQTPASDTLPSKGTLQAGSNLTSSRKIAPGGEGYQLLECIGRGAYGEVWRATAPGGVEVAVKLIKWGTGDSLSQVELRALELMKRLRHHFLSQVQAYWLADEYLYIVMDLADRSLQQRFDECKRQGLPGIPAPELLGYMREAAEALDYLHAHQVLHRDVKPANILLSSGHARLADFGLARLFMQEGSDLRATRIGTPLYMGPEVWEHKVGPSSDQYSLASTYVELRLGRPLFQADSQLEVMTKHLTMRPELQPLPVEEQRVLHRALAKKGDERYTSCVEFVTELQTAVLGDTRPGFCRISRRRLVIAGAVLATAIGLGLAGLKWSGYGFEVLSPAPTILPPGCQPAEGAKEIFVAAEGAKYWNRIIHALPGEAKLPSGKPVEFVLVPHHPEQKLASFYLQENKVWNELFAEFNKQYLQANPNLAAHYQFLEAHPDLVAQFRNVQDDPSQAAEFLDANPALAALNDWPRDWADRGADQMDGVDMPAAAYPQHPVMRVSHHQAEEFAKWLGGSLPSPQQWDAAAGLYELKEKPAEGKGPFQGNWHENPRPKVAVNRAGQGPVPVGSSTDDIAPSIARDMSGNGAEWTSEYTRGDFSTVTLRGRDYHKDRPLLYSDLLDSEATEIEREDRYYTSDHISFRVALTPHPPQASGGNAPMQP